MIMKLCDYPGCHELVPYNVRYCQQHQQQQQTEPRQPTGYSQYSHRKAIGGEYAHFYKSKAWSDLSYSYRLRHPLCEWCQAKGLYVQADVVDHIVPIRVAWDKRLDESNLQCLCNRCHWQKSADDRERYHLPKLGTPTQ